MTLYSVLLLLVLCVIATSVDDDSVQLETNFGLLTTKQIDAIKLYNIAVDCGRRQDFICSKRFYLEALELYPSFPEAHQNIAIILETTSKNTESYDENYRNVIYHHQKSVEYARDDTFLAAALANLASVEFSHFKHQNGNIITSMDINNKRIQSIIEILNRSLEIDKKGAHALFTIGQVYSEISHTKEAQKYFETILLYEPENTLALLNVGNFYFKVSNYSEAVNYYNKALNSKKLSQDIGDMENFLMISNNLGQSLREMGNLSESLDVFHGIVAEEVNNLFVNASENQAQSSLLNALYRWSFSNALAMYGMTSNWRNIEYVEHYLEQKVMSKSFLESLSILPLNSPVDPYTFSLIRFASRKSDKEVCMASCQFLPTDYGASNARNDGVLKIGYISFDWRDHPMGRLTQKLVTGHSNSNGISVSLYSYGFDDRSETRKYIKNKSGNNFIDVHDVKNGKDVGFIINGHNIDILIDITTHTYNGRINIAASKPAAVIINYLGFPGTTGCAGFDYTMVDSKVVSPETSRELFSEKLILLPSSYQANFMPLNSTICLDSQGKCRSRLVTATQMHNTRTEDLFLLCSFNANKKIEPYSFGVWMNIMREAPETMMFILIDHDVARRNILASALSVGINSNRIIFADKLSWRDHLARISSCDIVLDTFVYGAHTTTTDALWTYVPVISLSSWGTDRMPSRVASSLTHKLLEGLTYSAIHDALVANSVREYELNVLTLIKRKHILQRIKLILGKAALNSRLFDYSYTISSVEHAYKAVWDIYKGMARTYNLVIGNSISTSTEARAKQWIDHLKNDNSYHLSDNYMQDDIGSDEGAATTEVIEQRFALSFPRSKTRHITGDIKADLINCNDVCEVTPHRIIEGLLDEQSHRRIVECCLCNKPEQTVMAICNAFHSLSSSNCSMESALFEKWSNIIFELHSGSSLETVIENLSLRNFHSLWNDFHGYFPSLFPNIKDKIVPFYTTNSNFLKSIDVDVNTTLLNMDLSMILNNHVVCLLSNVQNSESLSLQMIGLLISSFYTSPTSTRYLNMGLGLELVAKKYPQLVALSSAVNITSSGIINVQKERYLGSAHHHMINNNDSTVIVIYCHEYGNEWWPNWGPSKVLSGNSGIGGSEEAVVYLSVELAKLGYAVEIYADPPSEDIGTITYPVDDSHFGSVSWYHYSAFDPDRVDYDVFISWRYALSLPLSAKFRLRALWLHDLIEKKSFPQDFWINNVDFVMVQSEFHKKMFLNCASEDCNDSMSVEILPNGIVLTTNSELQNQNNIFIYGSAPNRGLEIVLLQWATIKKHIPNAVLEIYYGFSKSVDEQLSKLITNYPLWKSRMIELLKQDGIEYYGPVDHTTLHDAYSRAGFLLYPSTFQETGCITVMKAMSYGAIPITSKLSPSVLETVTDQYDLGPKSPLTMKIVRENSFEFTNWTYEWTQHVIDTHTKYNDSALNTHRINMMNYARKTFTWRNSALLLHNKIEKDINGF